MSLITIEFFYQNKMSSPKGLPPYSPHRVGARGLGERGPFSHVREWPPLNPPREREGPSPSTPHIGSLDLEELHALRSVGAVYMASP